MMRGMQSVDRFRRLAARLQDSLPGEMARRFVETDLLTHAASLTFFALVSLAPLLVLVLWLAASLHPDAQQSLLLQIEELAGTEAGMVARTVLTMPAPNPTWVRWRDCGARSCCSSARPPCSRACRAR